MKHGYEREHHNEENDEIPQPVPQTFDAQAPNDGPPPDGPGGGTGQ